MKNLLITKANRVQGSLCRQLYLLTQAIELLTVTNDGTDLSDPDLKIVCRIIDNDAIETVVKEFKVLHDFWCGSRTYPMDQ